MQNSRGVQGPWLVRPHGGSWLAGPRRCAVDRGGASGPPVQGGSGKARGGVGRVHGGPAVRGQQAAVHGGPRAGAGEVAGRRGERRWCHGRGGGARRCGDAGHEKARQGHGRAWLDTTSAMAGSPPRNDQGKEKLDGGGADSTKTAAALRNTASSARVWGLGTALGF